MKEGSLARKRVMPLEKEECEALLKRFPFLEKYSRGEFGDISEYMEVRPIERSLLYVRPLIECEFGQIEFLRSIVFFDKSGNKLATVGIKKGNKIRSVLNWSRRQFYFEENVEEALIRIGEKAKKVKFIVIIWRYSNFQLSVALYIVPKNHSALEWTEKQAQLFSSQLEEKIQAIDNT